MRSRRAANTWLHWLCCFTHRALSRIVPLRARPRAQSRPVSSYSCCMHAERARARRICDHTCSCGWALPALVDVVLCAGTRSELERGSVSLYTESVALRSARVGRVVESMVSIALRINMPFCSLLCERTWDLTDASHEIYTQR
eukprot:5847809-Prymnesium_polylepis.1